ncbi:MAG: hypothetical protein Q9183_004170 [Haloplaca sp. 2 TL-2023]
MARSSGTTGKCIAWQRNNFTARIDERKRQFAAHEAFLCQSPVLERLCHAPFIESASLKIALPDDDPAVIAIIIHYLYTGNFTPSEHTLATDCSEDRSQYASSESNEHAYSVGILGEVYITADRLLLRDLQELTVAKLGGFTDVKTRPIAFLKSAKRVYAGIPDTDTIYRDFYQARIAAMANEWGTQINSKLAAAFDDCASRGGALALDSFKGWRVSYYDEIQKLQIRLEMAEELSRVHENRADELEMQLDDSLIEVETWKALAQSSAEDLNKERNHRPGD